MDILAFNEGSLSANLSTDFVVGQTGSGEQWDLLTSSNGGHGIDGRNTSLDHFLWIDSLEWVDWLTLHKSRIKTMPKIVSK
jgi:hypothetical protein